MPTVMIFNCGGAGIGIKLTGRGVQGAYSNVSWWRGRPVNELLTHTKLRHKVGNKDTGNGWLSRQGKQFRLLLNVKLGIELEVVPCYNAAVD
jgi:hypothetical protein